MQQVLTIDEVAKLLRIGPGEVASLVNEGRLGAYKIGDALRFGESHVAQFLRTCEIAGQPDGSALDPHPRALVLRGVADVAGRRECTTFGGRTTFPYAGSIETGTSVWPGKKVHFRLKFGVQQWSDLLKTFRGREVRAGLNFANPEPGSMGEWIKQNWNTKMGPAAYVGGILIAEGYAERPRPGWIRFFDERKLV